MQFNNIKYTTYFALAAAMLLSVSCKKDYTDPNRASANNAEKSASGLTAVVIGLQKNYTATRAGSVYNLITTDGFLTKQLLIVNQGNTAEYQFYLGSDKVFNTNSIVVFFPSSNMLLLPIDKPHQWSCHKF